MLPVFQKKLADAQAKEIASTGYISLPLGFSTIPIKVSTPKAADIKPPTIVKAKKGTKNLVEEAKMAKQKQAEAKEKAAKRAAQTARGNSRTGNSNKGTRGSHAGGKDRQKHTNADARRAADQKVKGPDNTY